MKKHQHLALGLYHQHSAEVLDLDASPLVFMRRAFPPPQTKRSEEMWRSYLAQVPRAHQRHGMVHGALHPVRCHM